MWTARGSKKRRVHSVAGWIWAKIRRKAAARPCTECQLTVSPVGRLVCLCKVLPYSARLFVFSCELKTRGFRPAPRLRARLGLAVPVRYFRSLSLPSCWGSVCSKTHAFVSGYLLGGRASCQSCAYVCMCVAELFHGPHPAPWPSSDVFVVVAWEGWHGSIVACIPAESERR